MNLARRGDLSMSVLRKHIAAFLLVSPGKIRLMLSIVAFMFLLQGCTIAMMPFPKTSKLNTASFGKYSH